MDKKILKQEIVKQLGLNPAKPVTIEIDFCPKVHPLFQEILMKHVKAIKSYEKITSQ